MSGCKPLGRCLGKLSGQSALVALAVAVCCGQPARATAPETDVSRLVQSLDDANLRYGASLALVRLGDQAVPALRKSLASTSLDQRVWSAFTLGEIGPAAAASAKDLTALLESSDAALRAAAAEALGKLGAASPASVGALAVRLSDDDIDVRQHAAVALGQIGPPAHRSAEQLVQSLSDSRTRRVAREALIRIGPSASPAVVAALSKDELRFDAVMVLRQADPAAARQAGVDRPGVDGPHGRAGVPPRPSRGG